MTLPKPTISDLLTKFSLWQESVSGYEVTYMHNNKVAVADITVEDLVAHDERLVPMLKHWFGRYSTSTTKANMGHSYIVNALRYWNDPLVLVDTDGLAHDVAHIDGIKDPDDDEIMLDVTACEFDYAGDLKYVSSSHDDHVFVSAASLDAQFPGWRQRYDIYQSLGLEETEDFQSYVFDMASCAATPTYPLPGVMT